MSEQAILWILNVLVLLVLALVGAILKAMWSKITAIDNGALASFRAMDAEREKGWSMWRESVDDRLDAKRIKIEDQEHRLTRLERNGGH